MAAKRGLLALLFLAGCAVPVPPSGGPPDDQPPQVISTTPETGTVSVRPDRVVIRFNEFIEARSVATAVSVTPELNRPPEIRPGGRSVEILFREPLRDNTTYIVTVDTGLRDAHGVSLDTPIRVAFATGDRINLGRLAGEVVRASDGAPDAGLDIYAWVVQDSSRSAAFEAPPDYRTQTDQRGRFSFSNLQETAYTVVGLRDGNRNRAIDPGEDIAWPPLALVTADSDSTSRGVWLSSRLDTTSAELRRATGISTTRLALTFDEPVTLIDRDPARWELLDTLSLATSAVQSVFQRHDNPRNVTLITQPLAGDHWEVWGDGAVADSSGNVGMIGPVQLSMSAAVDTSRLRFEGFEADTLVTDGVSYLRPGTQARLLFSGPPDDSVLRAGVSVSDTTGALEWTWSTVDGTRLSIAIGDRTASIDVDLQAFSGPDSIATFVSRPAPARALGEIAGVIAVGSDMASDTLGVTPGARTAAPTILVEGYAVGHDAVVRTVADSTGVFSLLRLPDEEIYRLRLIEDLNGNGRWDGGQLAPFRAPERLGWLAETPEVRARWETVLPDTLRIRPILGDSARQRP